MKRRRFTPPTALQLEGRSKREKERKYKLPKGSFDKMVEAQDSKCLICLNPFTPQGSMCVDHDHATDKVRGILCRGCNLLLGNAKDEVSILEKAIEYLEKHKEQS